MHTPRHARSVAELSDDELADVAEAWRRRREAVPDGYLHALVNEGREAGSSLPHTHSQLVWLPEPPPETQQQRRPRALDRRRRARRPRARVPVGEPPRLRARDRAGRAARAARSPTSCSRAALALLGDAVRRLHRAAGAVPLNAWLHDSARLAHRGRPAPLDSRRRRARRRLVDQRARRPRTPQTRCASSGSRRRPRPGAGTSFSSRKRRAASIAAPRLRPLSFACLISITVSSASMS